MDSGFKRLYKTPRRAFRGATLAGFTPRGKYIRDRSMERYLRRPDAYDGGTAVLQGEIGLVENFYFFISEELP